MKYHEFKLNDLVQIDHGNKPLGIVCGESSYIHSPTNTLTYPVLISDTEETEKYQWWYWPGGLRAEWDMWKGKWFQRDPFVAWIHPSYLIFLSGANTS